MQTPRAARGLCSLSFVAPLVAPSERGHSPGLSQMPCSQTLAKRRAVEVQGPPARAADFPAPPGSDADGDPDPPGRRGAEAPPRPPQAPALWGTSQELRPAGLGARPRLPMPMPVLAGKCTAHGSVAPEGAAEVAQPSCRAGGWGWAPVPSLAPRGRRLQAALPRPAASPGALTPRVTPILQGTSATGHEAQRAELGFGSGLDSALMRFQPRAHREGDVGAPASPHAPSLPVPASIVGPRSLLNASPGAWSPDPASLQGSSSSW